MDNFEFCVRIIRREQARFNVVSNPSIPKEITASSANDINYDIVHFRNAYLYRCGAVTMSSISSALNKFFLDYSDFIFLKMKWNSSSNLTFCSLSKGPALDYLAFVIALRNQEYAPILFKTVYVIAKHGAWRNTIRSMLEVFHDPPLEALKDVSLGEKIDVIQGDPIMSQITEKCVPALSESDVLFMVKSVKDDLDQALLKLNFIRLFSFLKVGALFFCIETKPVTKKLIEILSLFSGEMLYGPTEVSFQLGFDAQESYKTEFGCGPTQTARGVFFVWEKKHNTVPACELKEKTADPASSCVKSANNVLQRPIQDAAKVEFLISSLSCDNLGPKPSNAAAVFSLPLHSETTVSSSDSPFKRGPALAESLVQEPLPTLPDKANVHATDSNFEKAANSVRTLVAAPFEKCDLDASCDSSTCQPVFETGNSVTVKEKEDCDKKGNLSPCVQVPEQSESSNLAVDLLGSFPESMLHAETLLPTPVKNHPLETHANAKKESFPLIMSKTCFSQEKQLYEDCNSQSEVDVFSGSISSSGSISDKKDPFMNSSTKFNRSSKTNVRPTCDNEINSTHNGAKLFFDCYFNKHIQENFDCQPHITMVEKISGLTNQINQLTQSMKEALKASSLGSYAQEHSCEKKMDYNVCGHQRRNLFTNFKTPLGRCFRNSCCLATSSLHRCLKNKCCNSCPNANTDCVEHVNNNSCCLPAHSTHSVLKDKCCNARSSINTDCKEHANINSCCLPAHSTHSFSKDKCCNANSSINTDCKEHTNINSCCILAHLTHSILKDKCCNVRSSIPTDCKEHANINSCCVPTHLTHSALKDKCCNACSSINYTCQGHTKINNDHIQTPKLVIPLNCLPEEALPSVLKPMCTKLKKD